LALKEKKLAKHIIGVSRTGASAKKALELGLIDETLPLNEAVAKSDFIYVAIPVDATIPVVLQVMDMINDTQIVADAGSTKFALSQAIKKPFKTQAFCINAPMWGTEYSGPEAAYVAPLPGVPVLSAILKNQMKLP
jgi:prephenate dehydrogenase